MITYSHGLRGEGVNDFVTTAKVKERNYGGGGLKLHVTN